MKTRWLIVAVLFFILAGCRKKNHVPADILPPGKMQAVLWDIMRADKFLADFVLSRDSSLKLETESIKMYQQVFAIHAISKEKFQESFSWYKSHPSQLAVIMDSLNNRKGSAPTPLVIPADTLNRPGTISPLPDTGRKDRRRNPQRPD